MLPSSSASRSLRARWVRDSFSHLANSLIETTLVGILSSPAFSGSMPDISQSMAIGTIFVVTLVMADFSTVQVMSGGQSASVALMMKNQMSLLQYPAAAANAVVLLVLVLLMVAGILRIVDVRKEL